MDGWLYRLVNVYAPTHSTKLFRDRNVASINAPANEVLNATDHHFRKKVHQFRAIYSSNIYYLAFL